MPKIQTHAPGKLFLAGEYAVVSSYQPAIILPVDRTLTLTICQSHQAKGTLITEHATSPLRWTYHEDGRVHTDNHSFSLIWTVIDTVHAYLKGKIGADFTPDFFDLNVESQLDAVNGMKLGLGSSGALSVALVDGLLAYYTDRYAMKSDTDALFRFKLVAISHRKLNMLGSLGDVACAILKEPTFYQNFDREWFMDQEIQTPETIFHLIHLTWPGLHLAPLPWPKDWHFQVIWSEESASTEDLLKPYQNKKGTDLQKRAFLSQSKDCVMQIKAALLSGEWVSFQAALKKNFELIKAYTSQQQKPYMTLPFTQAEHLVSSFGENALFKVSGAGAGDCAFAMTPSKDISQHIHERWKDHHLHEIHLPLYHHKIKESEKHDHQP